MAIKNALLRKKIDDIMYDLQIQSTGDIVELSDGTTLNAKIAQIVSAFANVVTEQTIDNKISTSTETLYEKVTGFGPDTDINEAFDTIKEIADWLVTNEPTNAQDIVNDIKELTTAIETLETQATKVSASETNGNIIVDEKEVTVYTHSETHSAEMIEETDTKLFTTPEEKEAWNAAETMVHLDASSDETDYSVLAEVDSCTISFDNFDLAINYQNSDGEPVEVADAPSTINSEVGSSKFVQFTLPENYTVTSVTSVVDGAESPITYTTSFDNKVSFTVNNIGNLSYNGEGVPSYTTNHTVKVVLDIVAG